MQLLLSQKQDFLDIHLARAPTSTENQGGTKDMRDEVLSSVWAPDFDTSSYQLADLVDIEFNWENSQLDVDAVFRPGLYTPFSPNTFHDLSMEGSVENPIVLDDEKDKENAPPPSTPVSVRPKEPIRLLRSRVFRARIEIVPDYVYRNLFQ